VAREDGIYLPRISFWPWGKNYCLTVRHDVDRIPSLEAFNRLVDFEKKASVKASWYWLPHKFEKSYADKLESIGHENALHAVRLYDKRGETELLQRQMHKGAVIGGEQLHGAGMGNGWFGHPNVAKAREVDLTYTEMPTHYYLPGRFPCMNGSGHIEIEDIIGIANICSVDFVANSSRTDSKSLPKLIQKFASNGYYCMLLNHPDINLEYLKEMVGLLPTEGRLNWTCLQVSEWWRKTHRQNSLIIKKLPQEMNGPVFEIIANSDVKDLELVICLPFHIGNKKTIKVVKGNFEHYSQYEVFEDLLGLSVRISIDLEANQPELIHLKVHT
jgi:hypothetical protein